MKPYFLNYFITFSFLQLGFKVLNIFFATLQLNHKSSGKTALQVAAHQGHMEIIVLLVASGANLEIADDEGDTALHYSAFGYNSSYIQSK